MVGAQAAISLRQLGFAGTIAIFGDEPELPYERPPLSKEYLSGDKPFERLLIRPQSFWEERDVTFHLSERVTALNPGAHEPTASKKSVTFKHLIWAAGARPRRLSCKGALLKGVHSVRSRADVDRLASELPSVKQAVVIGGGYIGLEPAAVLRKLGKDVVLLETFNRVLARVAGEPLSRFFEHEHRRQGVDVRLAAQVDCIEGEHAVTGVRLHDGSVVSADLIVVGIGIDPAIEELREAGAHVRNGVVVDRQCRTKLPDVYAIGDCALQENRFADGGAVRLESVQNATDQAKTAARSIIGLEPDRTQVPWFWSNQ